MTRRLSDLTDTHGSLETFAALLGIPLDTGAVFGLYLNLERAWARPAHAVLRGTAAAFSDDDPPGDIYEATALYEAQGRARHWETVKARLFARAVEKAMGNG